MPRPVEAFPCGSRSTTRILWPSSARAAPRLTAVVLLPTPPFWLATAITRTPDVRSAASPAALERATERGARLEDGEARLAPPVSRGSFEDAAGARDRVGLVTRGP